MVAPGPIEPGGEAPRVGRLDPPTKLPGWIDFLLPGSEWAVGTVGNLWERGPETAFAQVQAITDPDVRRRFAEISDPDSLTHKINKILESRPGDVPDDAARLFDVLFSPAQSQEALRQAKEQGEVPGGQGLAV